MNQDVLLCGTEEKLFLPPFAFDCCKMFTGVNVNDCIIVKNYS